MKLPLLSLFLGLTASSLLAEEVVTLGDSLTYAYEGEFCFTITIPFGATYGDNMPSTVRNWIETLSSTTYRSAFFDQGTRITFNLDFRPFGQNYTILLRKHYNWAIPGLKVDEMRQFVLGEKTFMQLLEGNPDFADLATALDASTFNETTDFNVTEMNDQISNTAERVVFFIGGNDVRTVYGTVYNGGSAGTFVDDFIADSTAILDKVRLLKPNIQIVVVAVPHIGITPDIKADFPTDPVKTPRVTAMMRELNSRLEALAKLKGAGFADIYTPTLPMLEATPYGIHGVAVTNSGTANGNPGFLWLNGQFSANFHPNTNAQALIANEIVRAFNKRYNTGIAPLSATEMLGGLMGKTAPQIDMTFANWMTGFGLTGGTDVSDGDGDRIPAGVEFALGLNPILRDADQVTTSIVPITGGSALQMAYPKRLPTSPNFTLQATTSTNPGTPFVAVAPTPVLGSDGLYRAQVPITPGGKGFMRLQGTVTP